jgi:hypothetical protein
MATASHALYGVDVYSDSSEDSGNWESAGPRRSGGYRVEVSAGNATEKDRDAASDSDSDSEDDAMLVALVSAIACRADQPFVFDPRDPIRPDDFVFDSAAADEGGVPEDDDAWEDFFDDEECSASSLSASSEDLEGLEDLVEISRQRNAARRVTRPAPSFRRGGDSPNAPRNKNIDAFAATRPSAVGGRWGPPPKKNARASERTKPVKEKEQEPFAGPIPTVRAAVARAMAGALERETAKAERALFSRSPDDSARLLGTKNQSRSRVRTDSLIAAVADLSSRAEWAHEQAIGYELEGARSRSKYASPEKAEHFSSRRRRAPSSAFAKAPRTSLFAEIASAAAKRDGAGRSESDVSKTRPSDSRAKAVDGSAPPEMEKERVRRKTTETALRKKPKLDAVSSRARAPLAAKDESSSDESETDAWWTAPFGGVSFAAEKEKENENENADGVGERARTRRSRRDARRGGPHAPAAERRARRDQVGEAQKSAVRFASLPRDGGFLRERLVGRLGGLRGVVGRAGPSCGQGAPAARQNSEDAPRTFGGKVFCRAGKRRPRPDQTARRRSVRLVAAEDVYGDEREFERVILGLRANQTRRTIQTQKRAPRERRLGVSTDRLGRVYAPPRALRGVPPARRESEKKGRLAAARRARAETKQKRTHEPPRLRRRSVERFRRAKRNAKRNAWEPRERASGGRSLVSAWLDPRSRRVRRRGGDVGDASVGGVGAFLRAALAPGGDPRRVPTRLRAHAR